LKVFCINTRYFLYSTVVLFILASISVTLWIYTAGRSILCFLITRMKNLKVALSTMLTNGLIIGCIPVNLVVSFSTDIHLRIYCTIFVPVGHLQYRNEKMSKSLKNTISIREYLRTNSFNHLRMLCLYTNYRSRE
jgi:valyl-tRNA synthetase